MILQSTINEIFSIKIEINETDISEGNVYLYINNKRFGNDKFSFELMTFFSLLSEEFKRYTPYEGNIYGMDKNDIMKSLICIWEDYDITECPINDLYPNFYDDPSELTGELIFYGGYYAFDGTNIVMMSDNNNIRLIFIDLNGYESEEVYIEKNQICEHFNDLQREYADILKKHKEKGGCN